jgi:hypothetical protein
MMEDIQRPYADSEMKTGGIHGRYIAVDGISPGERGCIPYDRVDFIARQMLDTLGRFVPKR